MNKCLRLFLDNFKKDGVVVELGTKRWATNSTHHKHYWPNAKHIGVDFIDGLDVDIVCDVEKMSEKFAVDSIDAIFSASTFEHIRRPWVAAAELLKCLKPNGVIFIQSHEHFPRHAFPHDYWRFTPEAYKVLFEGATQIEVSSEFEATIVPKIPLATWSSSSPVFLNSVAYIKK